MCDTNRTGSMARGKKNPQIWVGRKGSMDTMVIENIVWDECVQKIV